MKNCIFSRRIASASLLLTRWLLPHKIVTVAPNIFPHIRKATMMRPLSMETRRKLCAAIAERCRAADCRSKNVIMDEYVKVSSNHCKQAIRTMKYKVVESKKNPIGKRIHEAAVDEALIVLWEAADRICGKRMKALLPTLVESMVRHGHLNLAETIRERLLSLSVAINRRLWQVRVQAFGARRKKRAINRVRKLVAVKTFADWGKTHPGFMEIDLVVHSGEKASGYLVHTLVLTDIA